MPKNGILQVGGLLMNIGLLGFGVVGGGVYELAENRTDLTVSRV